MASLHICTWRCRHGQPPHLQDTSMLCSWQSRKISHRRSTAHAHATRAQPLAIRREDLVATSQACNCGWHVQKHVARPQNAISPRPRRDLAAISLGGGQ